MRELMILLLYHIPRAGKSPEPENLQSIYRFRGYLSTTTASLPIPR